MRHRVLVMTATLSVLAAFMLAGCTAKAHSNTPPPSADQSASAAPAPSDAGPSPAASPTPSGPLFTPNAISLSVKGYWSWSYLDFTTGALSGSSPPNTTSDTASMAKSWVAADYLRRAAEKNQTPSSGTMAELSTMIRDSDNTNAFKYHVANGNLSSIQRMIKLCGMTDSKGTNNSWSLTQMSTRDITRLAKCISDGRAAGPKWTGWLLNEMRSVRGAGRFGIIEALPAAVAKTTAIKNGWLAREDGQWHIACMAIGDTWSIGVMARYPSSLGKDYGAKTCREVTKHLMGQA